MQFSAGMGQNHPYTICKPCQVAGMGLARKAVCLSGIRYTGGGPTQVSSSRGGDSGPDVMPGRARVSHDVLGSGVAGILGGPRNALLGDGKMQRRRLTGDEGVKEMEGCGRWPGGRASGRGRPSDCQTDDDPGIGGMLCNSRACDVLRGRRGGKGEGEGEGEKNGRRRVCYGRKVGYPGLPFPDIAVMVSSVPSVRQSRKFGTAPIMTNSRCL